MSHKKAEDPVLDIPSGFREEDELAQLTESNDVDKLRSVLDDNEVVFRMVVCLHEESDGVLAATNKRIVFADKKFLGSKVVSYSYSEVAAIVYATHLVTQEITLASKSRSFSVYDVDKEHGDRFLKFVGEIIGSDYTIEGKKGHVFAHRGDMLELSDLPSQQ